MSAGRRTSVQRHIDNPNIHNRDGRAMPPAGYSFRLRTGIYQRRQVPRVTSPESTDPDNLMIKIEREVESLVVREIAKKIFSSIPKEDFFYNNLESLARCYINSKKSKGLAREVFKLLDYQL
jgi:hypothetical protein